MGGGSFRRSADSAEFNSAATYSIEEQPTHLSREGLPHNRQTPFTFSSDSRYQKKEASLVFETRKCDKAELMSSSYHTAAPRAAAAVPLSRFRRDGDQEPGLTRENPAVHAPETAAPLSSGRSDHDEPSKSLSPSSSGIKGEEGIEDGLPMPVGKQAPTSTAMSGNIGRLGDGTGRDAQGSSSEPASSDNHAVSAVALLLLAASATSHRELTACKAGTSGGPFVIDSGFPRADDHRNFPREGFFSA